MHPTLRRSDIPPALGLLFTIGILFSPLLRISFGDDTASTDVTIYGLSTVSKLSLDHASKAAQSFQFYLLTTLLGSWVFSFLAKEQFKVHAYLLAILILTTLPIWLMGFAEYTVKTTLPAESITHFSIGLLFVALSIITSTFALLDLPKPFFSYSLRYKNSQLLDD